MMTAGERAPARVSPSRAPQRLVEHREGGEGEPPTAT
jgi:hypothetical protein